MNKATKLWWKDNWLTATLLMLMAVLLPMLFACCGRIDAQKPIVGQEYVYEKFAIKFDGGDRIIYEVTLENCEYWVTRGYGGNPMLAHKGNCKNHE